MMSGVKAMQAAGIIESQTALVAYRTLLFILLFEPNACLPAASFLFIPLFSRRSWPTKNYRITTDPVFILTRYISREIPTPKISSLSISTAASTPNALNKN
jgi:hypothetical protein